MLSQKNNYLLHYPNHYSFQSWTCLETYLKKYELILNFGPFPLVLFFLNSERNKFYASGKKKENPYTITNPQLNLARKTFQMQFKD